ncbi:tRNA uridine-5-carboxymethylaminomethyl(34) synthesis GTPase MnmE [Buchnera aphidicola]|uniref:tRNA modification GTPase MnmE n=1 Tax=Buchnera aphidicola subsp. Cinara cedri (strain Cc) TaxID=372461 RepID=MNME_BUCCC|nr:tRNA uridine-5-carboxymethylaminomethyl(34) synthesis GTPase MnmE [Buchnera aphidicola]Q058F5.1 RecName: Full=tRNA modification GTPase MnmE [Buchnera aphidicola BCc]ABJ90494.1 GTP-binding protein [Buchnera aphidicola BCc]
MKFFDTIVSPATVIGRSGIGIIRISGISVLKIIKKFLKISMKERFAYFSSFYDVKNNLLDQGIALFFLAPKSFTGENILEFHSHGNPIILDLLIKNILTIKNVRIANPGEFSKRAFLNNKIDLVQAEAINDIINAESHLSVKAALSSLRGTFSKKINKILFNLKDIYSEIEAIINFPEELNDLNIQKNIKKKLSFIIKMITNLLDETHKNYIFSNTIKIVIAGPPNVGKSSLLNFLSKEKVSIVTNIPGTTRDVIHKNIWFNGVCCEFLDTAGLQKSQDIIEVIGIKLAKKHIKSCNHIFLMFDVTKKKMINNNFIKNIVNNLKKNQNITFIFNKIDLINKKPYISIIYKKFECIYLSLKKNIGIEYLKNKILEITTLHNNVESTFLAKKRHISALKKSLMYLINGKRNWMKNLYLELLSDDIRLSIKYLLKITGKFNSEDLLDKIFSKFCIGK